MTDNNKDSRRYFLRQAIAWSALTAAPRAFASSVPRVTVPGAAQALILGDWGWLDVVGPNDLRGGAGFAAQTQVARGMQHFLQAQQVRPDALFLLGDNWYGDLAGGAKSPRWNTQFEQMYPAELFPCRAYAMLGNHDYQRLPPEINKVEAELLYARTGLGLDGRPTRWTMPARWYAFDFPSHKPLMRCIVLDSNMPRLDHAHKAGADFTLTEAERLEQLGWLEQELARPRTTPFLAVMAHHPIRSDGPHGDNPTLVQDWEPLLSRYRVDAYLAGHDHDLQALQFEGHPTLHFLSGGGGADLYVLQQDDLQRGPYAQEVHGFSHLSVSQSSLELRHLDASGRPLFGVRKTPGGRFRQIEV